MAATEQFNQALREWAEVFSHRSMTDFMRFVKAAGLSMPQVHALMHLYHRGACGVSDIGHLSGVTNAAASQLVDRLAQLGLLERAEDPHDRRAKQLTLTRRGRTLIEKGIEARRRWLEDLASVLTPEQQSKIVAALADLIEAARKLHPEETESN